MKWKITKLKQLNNTNYAIEAELIIKNIKILSSSFIIIKANDKTSLKKVNTKILYNDLKEALILEFEDYMEEEYVDNK